MALKLDDLIFPSSQTEFSNANLNKVLGSLKRSNLSITNRLRSIQTDTIFVAQTASELGLPLVANERCGSWYVPPAQKTGSAYFKSTDGHTGQWKFSTRRLNLHLLELIGRYDGCIIVDSTRRGKRMPDALSKTIPVWCCVLNRVLFTCDTNPDVYSLHVPPSVVSDSEKSQMEARIPGFVESFLALNPDLASLRKQISKPLRPLWVTPEDGDGDLPSDIITLVSKTSHPVVCCTASRRTPEMTTSGYIQGGADDHEHWGHGLDPAMFWGHMDQLLSTDESDLPDLIQSLVLSHTRTGVDEGPGGLRELTPYIFVGTRQQQPLPSDTTMVVTLLPDTTERSEWVKSKSRLEVGVGKNPKTAARFLRDALPTICESVSDFLSSPSTQQKRVVVTCESGKDLSIGVALALYCWCFDTSDTILPDTTRDRTFTKNAIRIKLGCIMTTMPDANPSRATLQSSPPNACSQIINLLHALLELAPVLHDDHRAGLFQGLCHHLLVSLLVRSDIPDRLDPGPCRAQGARLAVFHRDALVCRLPEGLHGVEVDGGVRLARRLRQGAGGGEDPVAKVLVLADLLDARLHAAQRAGADDRHGVPLRGGDLLELLVDPRAGHQLLLELRDDHVLLPLDVVVQLRIGQREPVALLQADHHAPEVLPDELADQRVAGELLLEGHVLGPGDLVDELGAALKGELFGQDERVVTVEEDRVDLTQQTH
ncbi:initiator tRNA phosphoribosyl transferase-domain-containing protein [Diplogelasinospora grovesii]|uniref:Initiator tRNA phosphoribosyl transferase-domain-containing protein n=1 Tax=Diplogelasinospora grovesii TaxID=303347 RepID=A0AAN6S2Q7_9PEZI|nr:initiator tRNA phosphoribosyl transferase-domain-containing protein [Diplogelasinospora grovesii]